MPQLLSVNIGLPQDIAWHGKTVRTAVWKHAVSGKRMVRRLNVDGDKQGDVVGHGGEHRAVLVYQIESYRFWEGELARSEFTYGQFGENFTVTGLPDDEVCIGDRYRIGGAVFEVTQPRVTCFRVGIRLGEPRMAALMVAQHRPGFYMRVLEEGEVEAGDEIVKTTDGPEHFTVADADALLYLPGRDLRRLESALHIDAFSPGWKTAFRNMADAMRGRGWAESKGLVLNSGSSAAWPGFRPMRVVKVQSESHDVFSIELSADFPDETAEAVPGQFITLRLPVAKDRPPILRSYSLTDTLDLKRYPISVKHEPHGCAGRYLREQIEVGDTIDVAAPRGGFLLRAGTSPVVLLSAGIGMTPVLAMLRTLAKQASTRSVWWIHGARDGTQHPFAREVEEMLHALPDSHRVIAYSHPLSTDRPGIDFDIEGRLGVDALDRFQIPRDADYYLCGPDRFMQDFKHGLASRGIPRDRIRTESFGTTQSLMPGVIDQPTGLPHSPSGPPGIGPLVSFARSGLAVRWDERYASLLELAEACNVPVRFACRTGVCHTCLTRLLAGSVAYQPEPLERPVIDNALICCSRPDGDVTLDI